MKIIDEAAAEEEALLASENLVEEAEFGDEKSILINM